MLTGCTPTMINDFDWFGIATDGPIVGSLEKGAFVKPAFQNAAGKEATPWIPPLAKYSQ